MGESSLLDGYLQYTVYRIICHATGKVYIGATALGIRRRLKNHVLTMIRNENSNPLYEDMRRYSPDGFSIEMLSQHKTVDEAAAEEEQQIAWYRTNWSTGIYNISNSSAGLRQTTRERLIQQTERYSLKRRRYRERRQLIRKIEQDPEMFWIRDLCARFEITPSQAVKKTK